MNFLKKLFNFVDFTRRFAINILFLLLVLFVLISFFSFDSKIDSYSSVVTLSPKKVSETTNTSYPFFEDDIYPLNLFEIISAINDASKADNVKVLFMDLSYLDVSYTGIIEIGEALNKFKLTGKKVVSYADFYDQKNYLLASYANEIILNKNGMVLLEGFSSEKFFIKQLLEKLKINVNTYISGSYKSALDSFTRDGFSEADANQTSFFISQIWSEWKKIISKNRKDNLSIEIDDYINNLGRFTKEFLGDTANLAISKGLVDKILYRPDLNNFLSSMVDEDKISLKDNLYSYSESSISENKFGVLVASGDIIDGEYVEGSISSENFSRVLEKIEKNNSIKGLFLRIVSPGGSGFASERIRQRLKLLSEKIPVVVSMGDIAASGGYWISMNDNEILASPFTLTGSIGVWAAIPNFKKSFEGIGVLADRISTNDLSLSLTTPPTKNFSDFMQSYVEGSYNKFISLVSKNRNLEINEVNNVAQGRIWPGQAAVDNKLVDSLGIFQDGMKLLEDKTGISSYEIEYINLSPGLFNNISSRLSSFVRMNFSFLHFLPFSKIESISNKRAIDTNLICLLCLNSPYKEFIK
jgi:protease-4